MPVSPSKLFRSCPGGVAKDDLLAAAAAAWTALWIDGAQVDSREYAGEEQQVDHTRKSRPDGP
jgi:hypothetical protein